MQDIKISNSAIFLSVFAFPRILSAITENYSLSVTAVVIISNPARAAIVCQSTKSE